MKDHVESVHEMKKTFKCINCEKNHLKNHNHLDNHVENIHEMKKSLKCANCKNNHVKNDHEMKKSFKCAKCEKNYLNNLVENVHETEKSYKRENVLEMCDSSVHEIKEPFQFHEGKKPLKCKTCDYNCSEKDTLNQHIASVSEGKKPSKLNQHSTLVHEGKKSLKIGSLNIGRGLFRKEELLINTIREQNYDIFGVSEVDIEDFDEEKPFTIEGFKSFFPLHRPGSNKKRLLCFVNNDVEVTQRNDLMSNLLSNVWLEVNAARQKTLICFIYREFSDLTSRGQLTIEQQLEKWKISRVDELS